MSKKDPIPTTVRGVVYPSQCAAARALGVRQTTVNKAARIGTLDNLGTGLPNYRKPITVNGVEYPSTRHAERAHGIVNGLLARAVRDGKDPDEYVASYARKPAGKPLRLALRPSAEVQAWLLSQVPEGGSLDELVVSILVDAYQDEMGM